MGRTALARQKRARTAELIGIGVLCALLVSGMWALVHEITWMRLLRLVLGNTAPARTSVVCAFMGGLALGSWLGGRLIERRGDPLRVFAFLQVSIGLYGLVLPWLIAATQPLYRSAFPDTHASFMGLGLVGFLYGGILLVLPATLLGATLPVLIRFFVRVPERTGSAAGRLHATHTFGAVLGVGAAGFLLIPGLGLRKTILAACLLDFLIAAAVLWLHRHARDWWPPLEAAARPARDEHDVKRQRERRRGEEPRAALDILYGPGARLTVLCGYALSGLAASVSVLVWTRAFTLLFGPSVYTLGVTLTAFFLALAAGSATYSRFVDRLRDPMRSLAVAQLGIGFAILLAVPLYAQLPFFVTSTISRLGGSFWGLQLAQLGIVLLLVLVPAALMGGGFPLASRLYARRSAAACRAVGSVYSSHILGATVGVLIGGFLLIPGLGLQKTLVAAAGVSLALGCAFTALSRSLQPARRAFVAIGALVVAAIAIGLTPSWDPQRTSFGPFVKARTLDVTVARSTAALQLEASKAAVIRHDDGPGTTLTVKQQPTGERTLYIDGWPDASSSRSDLITQEMLAHTPLLLHPHPRSALVIGLSSGITLAAAGRHPLERLDCTESSASMTEVCRDFGGWNGDILDDPRVRVLMADGRNHLSMTEQHYDVIISGPSNPWIAGAGDLFTREFFELCNARLTPRGLACIWLEAYESDEVSFRSVLAALRLVFPDVTIWSPSAGNFLMVGSKEGLSVDHRLLAQRMGAGAIAADLGRIGIHSPPEFLSHLVMSAAAALRFSEGGPIHTDDNARLEFSRLPVLARKASGEALELAIELHREVDLSFLAGAEQDAGVPGELEETTRRFMEARRHAVEARLLLAQGRLVEARAELSKVAALNPDDTVIQDFVDQGVALANSFLARGRTHQAIEAFRDILTLKPDTQTALSSLAYILASHPDTTLRDVPEAIRLAEKLARLTDHKDAASLSTLSLSYAAAGRLSEAETTARQAVALAEGRANPQLVQLLRRRLQALQSQQRLGEEGPDRDAQD
ncbi:MAG: fused MFS/spermidine synthase [Candidatus Krumholzibacteriia bacterium]